ncbi:murein biosynthesis integral membrane protein MurJ [Candidatus Falkowbacteria bacterium]|nr:murein biosynthesis integral membrane protein MurJ [Candidatus Falkowbacteria bacterium]
MLKTFFESKFQSITAAAVVIAAANLASRAVGIVRDRILASQFGAGNELDIYYAAFRIPDFIYSLVVAGAIAAGFIPVFVGLIKNDDSSSFFANQAAWKLANNILNITAVILIAACALLAVFTPWLIPLITPGFSAEKLHLTVGLTRVMFLSPILFGLSGIFGGILQSFRKFVNFAFAPVLYNVGIIFGALVLVKYFGLYGLAFGVIIGAGLHLITQVIGVYRLGFAYQFLFSFKDNELRKIIKLTIPRMLGFVCYYLNAFVVTIFASLLAAGSLAIYSLADNLQSFMIGIFGTSFAVAAFPSLSKKFNAADARGFCETFQRTFKQILFFILPSAALVIILRMQIVRVVLGAGNFDWNDTILTANTLGIFCFGLFAQAINPLLIRAFYARHNSLIPFLTFLFSVIINIFLNVVLIKKFGMLALAASFSAAAIVNFILLAVLLKIKNADIWRAGVIKSLLKISLATLLMGAAAQSVKTFVGSIVDMHRFWGIFTQGALAAIVGLLVFVAVGLLLRSEELMDLIASLKRRLWREVNVEKEGILN